MTDYDYDIYDYACRRCLQPAVLIRDRGFYSRTYRHVGRYGCVEPIFDLVLGWTTDGDPIFITRAPGRVAPTRS